MTPQEIFDTCAAHLLSQGKRSYLSKQQAKNLNLDLANVSCAYRGENNCKCAIGILIPDNEYLEEMEGKIPNAIKNLLNPDLKEIFSVNYKLLFKLQGIHDSEDPSKWEEKLKSLAKEYGLKPWKNKNKS